jgi:lactoylglutathione lyase
MPQKCGWGNEKLWFTFLQGKMEATENSFLTSPFSLFPPVQIPANFSRMSKVTKLLHTRYRVNDLERTIKFYRDVLGLEELQRHKSPRGSELVFLKAPESDEQIEICSFPAGGLVQVQPDLTHLAFEVDNLEAFGRHLAQHGLKYSDGPTTTSTGTVFAFIDAPEGYEIELIQKGKGGY